MSSGETCTTSLQGAMVREALNGDGFNHLVTTELLGSMSSIHYCQILLAV